MGGQRQTIEASFVNADDGPEAPESLVEGQNRVLGLIVRSADLTEILDAVCGLVDRHSEGWRASILLLGEDGRRLWTAAGPTMPEQWTEAVDGLTIGPGVGSCGSAAFLREPVFVSDIETDRRWEAFRGAALGHGFRACWSQPVLAPDGRVLGTFAVYRGEPSLPDREDRAVVGLLANTAALAIEHDRAETRLQAEHDRVRLLSEVAEDLLTATADDQMLRDLVRRLRGRTACGTIAAFVRDPDSGLRVVASEGLSPDDLAAVSVRCEAACEAGRPEVLESPTPPAVGRLLCCPLVADGRSLGAIAFGGDRPRFRPGEVEFLRTVGRYAAAACERLRLIGALREADRRKDEFLAMLAHELRNPLAPIRSGLDLLSLDPAAVDPVNVRTMRRQVRHLVRLVDDLLDVSRITRGNIRLRRTTVDLRTVLTETVDSMQDMVAGRRQTVALELPDTPVLVDADAIRLTQVFENLVTNASKYSGDGENILVRLAEPGPEACVEVKDSGVGMDAQFVPRAFNLFAQSERSLDRSEGGLGIGLTLVDNLVRLHGGTIRAESDGVGTGSRFVVTLPTVDRAADPSPEDRVAGAADVPRTVVLVDDNDSARFLMTALLRKIGEHEVAAYADAEAALEDLDRLRPDVVVLDIGLPGMDGYEAARLVRDRADAPCPLLVALTGYGTEDDRRIAEAAGFDMHLAKPASIDQMRRVLSAAPSGAWRATESGEGAAPV